MSQFLSLKRSRLVMEFSIRTTLSSEIGSEVNTSEHCSIKRSMTHNATVYHRTEQCVQNSLISNQILRYIILHFGLDSRVHLFQFTHKQVATAIEYVNFTFALQLPQNLLCYTCFCSAAHMRKTMKHYTVLLVVCARLAPSLHVE